jgi:hypothetical protein
MLSADSDELRSDRSAPLHSRYKPRDYDIVSAAIHYMGPPPGRRGANRSRGSGTDPFPWIGDAGPHGVRIIVIDLPKLVFLREATDDSGQWHPDIEYSYV